MHVPEKVRRSVLFIGNVNERGVFIPRATAFLVQSHSKGDDEAFPHIVTAEHVVSGMQTKKMEIYCRINLKGGGAAVESLKDISGWYFHPDSSRLSDVAVAPVGLNLERVDHDYMPLFEYPWSEVGPAFKPRAPGLGDDVFETLYQPELKALRQRRMKESRELKGATADVDLAMRYIAHEREALGACACGISGG